MDKKKTLIIIISVVLAVVLAATAVIVVLVTTGSKKRDAIVIMTDDVSGLFNPYYATSGADMEVTGMTQIGMLTTDKTGTTVAGDEYPTVVKDFEYKKVGDNTEYTFVIKNGLKFSDGKPLTMNDVMFNIYEYLDPVYTGSSTMYSIKIAGLKKYRTQQNMSGGVDVEDQYSRTANSYATLRKNELILLYETMGKKEGTQNTYSMTESEMYAAINNYSVTSGYKDAVATVKEQQTMGDAEYRAQLKADYDLALTTFRKELESDYSSAQEAFDTTTVPYKDWADKLNNSIFRFFLYEGYIKPVYKKVAGKDDKTVIEKFEGEDQIKWADDDAGVQSAINKVYKDTITESLNNVLTFWGTAGTLTTEFAAKAKDVLIHNNLGDSTELTYPNIEGVVSLGHTTDINEVTVKNTNYKVAHSHNSDGTPTNSDEYDVLRITVEGTDPKAIFNFGFTVAPHHYYSADDDGKIPTERQVDIARNKFGVEYSSYEFQSKVIQSQKHVEVPVGAGAYMATDRDNNDTPRGQDFVNSKIVYYKANENFMFPVKAKKIQLQVISASNALDKLENNEVDYITPQFTIQNSKRLTEMEKKGFVKLSSWQLGYGYIGVNAGKVPNINIRRAIMSAMQTALALNYYEGGTAKTITWPMSTVSWAYPFEADGTTSKSNNHDYTQWTTKADAEAKIQKYMNLAGVSAGSSELKIRFTIAGASITEHPTYPVFLQASEILNGLGWNVEVKADSQALTKLSTGSLEVWAAAWGSTIDPDMYQVYHKNSTATSVYSWGYREIKASPALYPEETRIINNLSTIIDEARSIDDRAARKEMYENAMGLVLDLAVELPVYQRMTLYAYNSNNITGLNDKVNPYSSPLEKIWDIQIKE